MNKSCTVQNARKGVLFDDFPPVLQLQLKRFEYDFRRDIMVKVRTLITNRGSTVILSRLRFVDAADFVSVVWPLAFPFYMKYLDVSASYRSMFLCRSTIDMSSQRSWTLTLVMASACQRLRIAPCATSTGCTVCLCTAAASMAAITTLS